MYTNNKLSKAVRLAIAFGAASATALATNVAVADEADAAQSVERIEVTGSRILKQEFTSNAPVVSVDAEQFELGAIVNTESLLNTLPQLVPGFDRTSNNPGNGTATADLRGLGTNRTLVLVNGTRMVPTTAGGTVDINTIPTSLINRVEVLTGGASAVYGSDAVAGVVNFVLKRDFEGVQINTGARMTERGDAEVYNGDITFGASSSDGRGNVVFNFGYTERKQVFQDARSFARTALFDNGDSTGLEPGGSTLNLETTIFNAGFEDYSPDTFGVIFTQDGGIRQYAGPSDDYNYAPSNFLQLPQKRYQMTSLGHYELTDNLEVYGRAMFTSSRVPSQLAPTPIAQTSVFTLDGNPFLTAEAQQVLSDAIGVKDADGNIIDSNGNGIADEAVGLVRRRLEEIGPRYSDDHRQSFQFTAGVRGFFPDSNWGYDAYYQHGQVTNNLVQLGNINRGRFDQALLLDLEADPAGGVCQDTSANGGLRGCVPINIFGEGNINPEAGEFLVTRVNAKQHYTQSIKAATVFGDTDGFFELPGGPVGLAFGVERIDNKFDFSPSQDLAANTIAGFNGSPPSNGAYDVTSVYGEAYLPILIGEEYADVLELELAYRFSDYSTSGSSRAYKVSGAWAPNSTVRFRAGWNRAVRAPNIAELFSPASEGFPSSNDPCSANAPAASQTEAVRAICVATGAPAAAVFTPALNLASGQVRAVGGGNPELKEEVADTYTAGFVLTPMDNLSVSLDYFNIKIDDAIAGFGGGANNILSTCYDTSSDLGGAGSPFCNSVVRRGDGSIDFVRTGIQNVASEKLEGVDLVANFRPAAFDNKLVIDYVGTYTMENTTVSFVGADPIKCAGLFGADCGQPQPSYKHRMTFRYMMGDATAQLLWRHIGSVKDDDDDVTYFVNRVGAANYFDFNLGYQFSDAYRLTFGIENLLDKNPPVLGDNDQQANTWPQTYDVFGRAYFLNFTARF
jgi:iron complex outermembrane receptor protein